MRSALAHGEIQNIGIEATAAMPGVVAIFTGADLATDGICHLPCALPLKNRDGTKLIVPPRPCD